MRPAICPPTPARMPPTVHPSLREQAADWALRLDEGELPAEQREQLLAWLDADPAHADALQRAVTVWRALDDAVVASAAAPSRPDPRKRARAPHGLRGQGPRRVAFAAGIACALLLALGYTQLRRADIWLHADQRTAIGETRQVTLSGGSTALLDSHSAMSVQDGAQWREVKVFDGAVSFAVGHDDARPFRVRAGEWTVTDVGTTFQLERRDDTIRVVVASGLVDVSGPYGRETVRAGEQALITPDATRVIVRPVDVDAATAWTRGRLVFVDRPLREVVDELNRYYDGRIVLLGGAVAERRVSGVFRTAEPLAALGAIERNLGLRAHRLGAGVIVLRD